MKRLEHLLDHDFNGLLNAFYRINIEEQQLKQVLRVSMPEFLSSDLTELLIKRQVEKAIRRRMYAQE